MNEEQLTTQHGKNQKITNGNYDKSLASSVLTEPSLAKRRRTSFPSRAFLL